MGAGLLSQDEMKALLGAGGGMDDTPPSSAMETPMGSTAQQSIDFDLTNVRKLFTYFQNSAVNVLSTIIGQDIKCELVNVECLTWESVKNKISGHKVVLDTKFSAGFSGDFKIFVDKNLGGVLAELMTGADGSVVPDTLTELHESAINEGVNQMIASGLTGIAGELKNISLSTDVPNVKNEEINSSYSDNVFEGKNCIIGELSFSVIHYTGLPLFIVMPTATADSINAKFSAPAAPKAVAPQPAAAPPPQQIAANVVQQSGVQENKNVANSQKNIMLLMDIPILLSVNLGQTKMLLRDILKLGVGSIIELDKVASDPIDLAAGVKPIARGEVVVVDENFGLRLTELVSPYERIEILKREQ